MRRGANMQLLRMSRHSPAGEEEHSSWNEVPLRLPTVMVPAQPQTDCTSTPPDDTNGSMLPIIANPRRAPVVFSECVDAAPYAEDSAVIEFLGAATSSDPDLADKEYNCEDNTVADESAAHYEMSSTLTEIISLTES